MRLRACGYCFPYMEAEKIFKVEMHFVDSRMFERIDGRKPYRRYIRSPKDTSSNFCHLHIGDTFFGEVHTEPRKKTMIQTVTLTQTAKVR
jgi:hypothetical protein